MPITNTDIVVYGSTVMPENDSVTNIGGSIDLTTLIVFTDITPAGTVEMISTSAGDTGMQMTLTGRGTNGIILTETLSVNGTNVVSFSNTYERFMKFSLSGVAVGTITVRKAGAGSTIATLPPGILKVRQPFYNAVADYSGGASREFHEKIFIRNNHATLTLTEAVIIEQADSGNNVTFALESSLNGTDTNGGGNTRLVAPGGYTFNSSNKNVANGQNHTALNGQGIWLKLTLPAGATPAKNTYTIRETGVTT